jgi:hypothetical protein
MTENKKIAGQMVTDELRFLERHARETGGIVMESDGPFHDLPDFDDQCVMFSIGARDELTRSEARKWGRAWRRFVHRYPNARIYIHLLGYDDDPREIWEIASAAEYVRQWAKYAGIADIKEFAEAEALPLHRLSLFFLLACGAFFGEEMGRLFVERMQKRGDLPPTTARN